MAGLNLISYRRCNAHNISEGFSISALVGCDESAAGCAITSALEVFTASSTAGLLSSACFPDEDLALLNVGTGCNKAWFDHKCKQDSVKFEIFRTTAAREITEGWRFWDKEYNMRKELLANGPMFTTIHGPADLRTSYTGGVYSTKTVPNAVAYNALIVGFGVDSDGTKYWKLQLNFGLKFGEDGFMRIARGKNVLEVENYVYAVDLVQSSLDAVAPTPQQAAEAVAFQLHLRTLEARISQADEMQPALDNKKIAQVNADPKATWVAGRNARFEGKTMADAKRLLGVRAPPTPVVRAGPVTTLPKGIVIPDSYDYRQHGKCNFTIRDQGQCGSCWAFSSSSVFSRRLCMESDGAIDVALSPQELVDCACLGCQGGYLNQAWDYLAEHGAVEDACVPYTALDGTCPDKNSTCTDGSKFSTVHHAQTPVGMQGEVLMQLAILRNGPIQAAFSVDSAFMQYKSGVFNACGDIVGLHAISVLGWGTTSDNQKYWIIANSWGTSWGMDGIFYFARGDNICGIESNAYAGFADLSQ